MPRKGFTLDPALFTTDARTLGLGPCEIGGLVLLLSHAWAAGGRVPGDDESLAALTRLGPSWEGSTLRARLGRFFVENDQGGLASIDLAPQIEYRHHLSEANRKGGLASGRARKRTNAERTLNDRSTNVERSFAVPVSNCTPSGRVHDPETDSSTHEPPQFTPPEAPPVGGSGCAPDVFSLPPHTPLYRDSSSSLEFSSPEEKKGGPDGQDTGGSGGCGGQEGEAIGIDLFGVPILPRRRKARKARPTAAHREEAALVVDAYVEEVGSDHLRHKQADDSVAAILANGIATAEDLRAAIRNYAREADRLGRDPQYRYSPHNFFSRTKMIFRRYVKEEPKNDARKGGNTGRPGRVRTGANYDGIAITITETGTTGGPATFRAAADPGLPDDRPNPLRVALDARGGGGG